MSAILREIELENYRSFKNNIKLQLDAQNILCVVGPSGSGKSNFVEAISFVMGCEVPVREIPFNNTSERVFVKVVFVRADGTLITFKRTILEDRNIENEFDNEVVTLDEYKNHLAQMGVNSSIPNFVFDINKVNSPEARSRLIETFGEGYPVGTEHFKLAKDRYLQEKLLVDELQNRLNFVSDRLHNEGNANENERRILDNKQALRNYKITYNKFFLYHKYAELTKFRNALNRERAERQNIRIEGMDEVANWFQSSFVENRTIIQDMNQELDRISNIKKSLKKILDETNVKNTITRECETFPSLYNVQHIETSLAEYKNQLADVENKLERHLTTKPIITDEQMRRYNELYEEFAKQAGLNILKMSYIDDAIELLTPRLVVQPSGSLSSIENYLSNNDDRDNTLQMFRGKKLDLDHLIERTKRELDVLMERFHETSRQLIDNFTKSNEENLRNRIEMCTAFFSNFYPEYVCGLLSSLCRPSEERYTNIVSGVLRASQNTVVVVNSDAVDLYMPFMKNIPRIRFIPLQAKIDGITEHQSDGLIPLKHAFQYDERYTNVFTYVCQNVMICETDEQAQTLISEPRVNYHIVSLNGHFFVNDKIPFPKCRPWPVSSVREEPEQLEGDQNQLNSTKSLSNDEVELKILTGKIMEKKETLIELKILTCSFKDFINVFELEFDLKNQLRAYLESQNKDLKSITESFSRLHEDFLGELESRKQSLINLKQPTENEVIQLKNEIFHDFCDELNIESIDAFDGLKTDLENQKEMLKKKIDFAELSLREAIKLRESCVVNDTDAENLANLNTQLENSLNRFMNMKIGKERAEDGFNSDFKELLLRFHNNEHKIRKLHDVEMRIKLLEEYSEIDKQMIFDILFDCKTEDIPLVLANNELLRDIPDEANFLENFENFRISSNDVPAEVRNIQPYQFEQKLNEILNKCNEIESELLSRRQIGGKILTQEDSSLQQMHDTISNALQRARESFQVASNTLENMRTNRCEKFQDYLRFVSNELKLILRHLTGNVVNKPLISHDRTEPFLHGVQYKFAPHNDVIVDNLSDDELTTAGCAFIFALHKFKIAPLLVIDHMSAASENTYRRLSDYQTSQLLNTVVIMVCPLDMAFYFENVLGMTVVELNEIRQTCVSRGPKRN